MTLNMAVIPSFGGIQFNTALKPITRLDSSLSGFGGIQFNTALKLYLLNSKENKCFGGIQFNTALKPDCWEYFDIQRFGGIQFNTALKLSIAFNVTPVRFWRHSIQHSSKTLLTDKEPHL